jgi:hypothetical protein
MACRLQALGTRCACAELSAALAAHLGGEGQQVGAEVVGGAAAVRAARLAAAEGLRRESRNSRLRWRIFCRAAPAREAHCRVAHGSRRMSSSTVAAGEHVRINLCALDDTCAAGHSP